MKKSILLLGMAWAGIVAVHAGVTSYEFTSVKWASKTNGTVCDGKTDGWKNDKDASSYDAGRTDAKGRLYSCGVSVKTGTSGAGATSVKTFEGVRKITINFCQNASDGRGTIYVQIADNTPIGLSVTKPASGQGSYNRDSVIILPNEQTGKVRFWVECSHNAINIRSITLRHAGGGSSPFAVDTYQLVTDAGQLQDSDQIIIGVHQAGKNMIMGFFDKAVSKNNIHAIRGNYSSDRQQVGRNDNAIYTLRTTMLGEEKAFFILDELRYEGAYLVASGGRTKNRLALWDKPTDPDTYGDYGYWDIEVSPDGEASIVNKGKSVGKVLQYNAVNTPTLFSCYAEASQTPVCLYRCVKGVKDTTAIAAPLTHFGTQLLKGDSLSGAHRITVQANGLKQDIRVRLKHGEPFALSDSMVDRDGDYLTVSFCVKEPGTWRDTLELVSGEVRTEALVMLTVKRPATVAQAVKENDYEQVWLNDVVVTKKYDTYIFVRDSSGSMLIFDNGDGTGHRYGSGLENGHVLQGVTGRMKDYFGVPELIPAEKWQVAAAKQVCEPEEVNEAVDSAMVCRYVRVKDAVVDDTHYVTSPVQQEGVLLTDAFETGIEEGTFAAVDAVVMMVWDAVELWCVKQHVVTGIEDHRVESNPCGKIMMNGQLFIRHNDTYYTAMGQRAILKM